MSFCNEWEQRFSENTHMSIWPWSDLVSLVKRNCKQLEGNSRVLEFGCGAGANIPFFQSLGVQYYAIEGSKTIVSQLNRRFPDLANTIKEGDFTLAQPFDKGFELVVDRAAVTCNSTSAIRKALQLAWDALAPGGYYLGIDWYSKIMSDFKEGMPGPDDFTRCGYKTGTFTDTGNVHFSDKDHILDLFRNFEIISLEEKTLSRIYPNDTYLFASWLIVARKPNE